VFSDAPDDRYATIDGIKARFWAVGEGDETPIILIHGLGGSVESWIRNVRALGEHHPVYALDLPGFGRSDKPSAAPYTFSYFASFVRDFIVHHGFDRANLVGLSMGGGTSLQFAIDYPDRLDKLVLVDAAGLADDEPHRFFRLAALPLIGEWLMRPSREGAAESWRICLYDTNLITEELVDRAYELSSLPGAKRSFLATTRALIGPFGRRERVLRPIQENLDAIQAPTLVVWGREDEVLSVSGAYVAQDQIPDAKLHIFERCGHVPQFECAEGFNDLVLGFLES